MKGSKGNKNFSPTGFFGVLVVLLVGSCAASGQDKPAPAKSASPSKVPSAARGGVAPGAAKSGAATSHGPTTASGGHGPTTGSAASHGPTTSSPNHVAAVGHTTGGSVGTRGKGESPMASRPVPIGSHTVRTSNGSEVRTRANGRPADVHVAEPKYGHSSRPKRESSG